MEQLARFNNVQIITTQLNGQFIVARFVNGLNQFSRKRKENARKNEKKAVIRNRENDGIRKKNGRNSNLKRNEAKLTKTKRRKTIARN